MKYKYTASDKQGNQITGILEAKSREGVVEQLHEKNLIVVSVDESLGLAFKSFGQIQIGGYSLKDRLLMTKQLVAMLQAGLPLTQAMNILKEQVPTEGMKNDLDVVYADLQNGIPLSTAFGKNTKIFSEVQLNLMAAGEKSGNLVEILQKVQEDMSKANTLRSKIRGALIYPTIIFIAVFVVLAILVFFMVPEMEKLYSDFGLTKLPTVTNIVVTFAHFVTSLYGLMTSILLLMGAALTYYYYKSTQGGKRFFHKIFLKVPVFGPLNEKIQVAEFARLLSLLLSSGVPIIDALNIVANSTSNVLFEEVIRDAADKVSKGVPLAVPLSNTKVFPSIFTRVVAVGEETGELDQILLDMAKFYDEEVTATADNLTKLMEPFILLVVGLLVAFLAVAIYWPIYSLGGQI